jgi:hypothetical protein
MANGRVAYNECPGCGNPKSLSSKLCWDCQTAVRTKAAGTPMPPKHLGPVGKARFHLFSVTGWTIDPKQSPGRPSGAAPTTWSVLDSHNMWLEAAVFTPTPGHTSDWCQQKAEVLCKRLNREEVLAAPETA